MITTRVGEMSHAAWYGKMMFNSRLPV
jgi:hypothetical protein